MSGPASIENDEYTAGVRLILLNLPEDEGEGLGFRLTRTLWDPYPWVHEVSADSRADAAGLKTGDCILQADGKDLLGLPVSQVAGIIRGDGGSHGVSLLLWNCGVDPKDDPELLWSCGGGSRGERARRALSGAVRALACCVCTATATTPLACARSHLYCDACWARLERCALCREQLPPKESPYARNLVAEQVFEAIAKEYEIKNVKKHPKETLSAYSSPNRSPSTSPSPHRRGKYQLSMMNRKKVQFTEKFGLKYAVYASDPNIHRSIQETRNSTNSTILVENLNRNPTKNEEHRNLPTASNTTTISSTSSSTILVESSKPGNSKQNQCNCQSENGGNLNKNGAFSNKSVEIQTDLPEITIQNADFSIQNADNVLQHKIVAKLRKACSLADLQKSVQNSTISRSLNNLDQNLCKVHGGSLDNLKTQCNSSCDAPVFLIPPPQIYVVTCDHNRNDIPT